MDGEVFIIPAEEDSEEYMELSRSKSGRLYRKHILSEGEFYHPKFGAKPIKLDTAALNNIKKNFDNKVCDIVQVPLANERNEHSENPLDNLGEVVNVEVQNGKLYAYMDIRDPRAMDAMGRTMLGASAMLAFDYMDTRDGINKGPTLLHTAVTNRPHLLELEGYEEILAASADVPNEVVLLSAVPIVEEPIVAERVTDEQLPEETKMTLEELLSELKTEHDIDVTDLQTRVTDLETANTSLTEENASLSNTNTSLTENVASLTAENAAVSEERDNAIKLSSEVTGALEASGVVSLSNGAEITPADVIGAVSELAQGHLQLSARVKDLATKDANNEVDSLVATGRVFPTQKEWLVDLKLSNPSGYNTFLSTLPETPSVPMNKETGVTTTESAAHEEHLETIARLTSEGGAAWKYIRK